MKRLLAYIVGVLQHTRKPLTAFVMVALIATTFTVSPRQAHAIPVEEVGPQLATSVITTVKSTLTAAATYISAHADLAILMKEFTFDNIAYFLAKQALNQVRKSTIRWINSGFQGSPAFVTDLQQFLIDSADEIAGQIIYGSELGFLCSPFELDVRLALLLNYNPGLKEEVQCTLSGVVSNVEDFLGGNFAAGGLPGWFEVTTNPTNNFFGAQAGAKVALRTRLQDGREREIKLLEFGDGFISSKECLVVGFGDSKDCTINMPGKAISETLAFELSIGGRELIAADEINEVVSALVSQLALQALRGAGGLLGLGRSGGSGYQGTSYLDRMGDPTYDPLSRAGTGSYDFIGTALTDERKYQGFHDDIIARAEDILTRVDELENPPNTFGENDPKVCRVPSHIPLRATAIRNEATENKVDSDVNVLLLEDLQTRFTATENATSTEELEARQDIVNEFLALQSSGTLHDSVTNAQYEFTADDLKEELSELSAELEDACSRNNDDGGRA